MIKWRFEDRIKVQMNAFKKASGSFLMQSLMMQSFTLQGFEDIIPLNRLKIFDEREVEVNLCTIIM